MEATTGTIIKKSDLKIEKNNYSFFLQLIDLCKKSNITPKVTFDLQFFEKYDHLLITMEDEIKDPNNETIEKTPGAYLMTQQLFVSG